MQAQNTRESGGRGSLHGSFPSDAQPFLMFILTDHHGFFSLQQCEPRMSLCYLESIRESSPHRIVYRRTRRSTLSAYAMQARG